MKAEITTKGVFLYIVKMLKSFPGALFVMFTVAIVFAIDTSVKPYILKVIIDRATENSEQNVFQYLAIPSLCYLLMNFILATSWRIYDYFVQINMFPRLCAGSY